MLQVSTNFFFTSNSVLAHAKNIRELDLSYTGLHFGAFPANTLDKLQKLSSIGNKATGKEGKESEFVRFIQNSSHLTELNIANSSLTAEILKQFTSATVPYLRSLDVSDNDLGDLGIIALCDAISIRYEIFIPVMGRREFKSLNIGRTFYKRTRDRPKAIQALVRFLNSSKCNIELLDISGNQK